VAVAAAAAAAAAANATACGLVGASCAANADCCSHKCNSVSAHPVCDCPTPDNIGSHLWNAMIVPLTKMNIKGAVFYQVCAAGSAS
jgi:hypothetical protein